MLIARNQSDRWSDSEVVKNLYPLLVFNCGRSSRELLDAIFQVTADRVVVEPRSEAVIIPSGEKTVCKQSEARVSTDGV